MEPQDTAGHPQAPLSASERLAAALGRPTPRKLSETEVRDFERRQDAVDAEIERIYRARPAA